MQSRRAQESATYPQTQTVLVIDPAKASREKAAALVESMGLGSRAAADVFEAHALVDGAAAVIATHPASGEIYPRLRASGVPLIASFGAREPRPAAVAAAIEADAFVVRPYRRDTLG